MANNTVGAICKILYGPDIQDIQELEVWRAQQTLDIETILGKCWPTVYDVLNL